MKRQKAWVWFKGGVNESGSWVGGFLATNNQEEGILIERTDFVSCRVPEWRVRLEEPENETKKPTIPEKAIWKYIQKVDTIKGLNIMQFA